ncbi:acetyl-CoA synthetase-like protein [Trametes meyenii]|nr:acetyl-CoA synthetase-like protein [Trametes meyenii]
MPPQPTPQGVNHPTFHPLPFDHNLSIPQLYEYHARHSPAHPVFAYADPDTGVVHDVTFAEAWDCICAVASIILQRIQQSKNQRSNEIGGPPEALGIGTGGRRTIGILAPVDTLTYIYTMVAVMALGYTAFPLATINNAEAVAHLLGATGTVQLLAPVGEDDEETQRVAREAADILRGRGTTLELLPMVKPEDYLRPRKAVSPAAVNDHSEESGVLRVVDIADEDTALILHSSGSTGMPKPIRITRKGLTNTSKGSCFGEIDLAGRRIAAHTNPACHALGVVTVTWPLSCGATFALYPPTYPPTVPTPLNFLAAWAACKCDIVISIPAFIEALAYDEARIPALKALDYVVYSGASMTKTVGDALAAAGVKLASAWGSTEVGVASLFLPRALPPPSDWEYFAFSPHMRFHMVPDEDLEHVFEPVRVSDETFFAHVHNTEVDGQPAFAMGDLLEQHPTNPAWWRVLGRKDDQIVLLTGENINPVPIEDTLAQDEHVESAIVFGQQRMELGVLVEPKAEDQLERPPEEVKDEVWPAIKDANSRSLPFAHIRKEMVLVTSPDKPLAHTAKNTTRREVSLKQYTAEMENLYQGEADVAPEKRQFRERM